MKKSYLFGFATAIGLAAVSALVLGRDK
jgi:hypothetical protein